jgi:UDP-N-acetylglucosamine transferase subunit ALG13
LIFVTVGTHNQGFERLVKKIDEIAGELEEEVVIQRGHTSYEPMHARFFDFAPREEMGEWVDKARLIVTHGGAGSIVFALSKRKPVVVVPRLKKYGEHVNDHQIELARALEKEGRVKAVLDVDELKECIDEAEGKTIIRREKPVMVEEIKKYLHELER